MNFEVVQRVFEGYGWDIDDAQDYYAYREVDIDGDESVGYIEATKEGIMKALNIESIDTRSWQGKYLALGAILEGMEAESADAFLSDIFKDTDIRVGDTFSPDSVVYLKPNTKSFAFGDGEHTPEYVGINRNGEMVLTVEKEGAQYLITNTVSGDDWVCDTLSDCIGLFADKFDVTIVREGV